MQILYVFRRRARRLRRRIGGDLQFRILSLAGLLALLFALHVLAMWAFEDLSLGDAAWLTITTATTVGYGDISASSTAGRWATALLMYVGGIFVLAQLAGLIFEATQARLERQRYGKVELEVEGHVVLVGYREDYVRAVVEEIRASVTDLHDAEIVVVSPTLVTLPEDLAREDVHHVSGSLYGDDALRRANVARAARVAILPEERSADVPAASPSTEVFVELELVTRLAALAPGVPVVYAAHDRRARRLSEDLGAADAFVFDPNYPDLCARAILTVGAEDIIDDLLDREGARLITYEAALDCTVGQLLDALGTEATLLGLRSGPSKYRLHPAEDHRVRGDALVLLVDAGADGDEDDAVRARIAERLRGLEGDVAAVRTPHPERVGLIGPGGRIGEGFLRELRRELRGVRVQHLGEGEAFAMGAAAGAGLADVDTLVILAADPTAPASDALTHLVIRELRGRSGFGGRIIAEAVRSAGRARCLAAGATDVLRPVRENVDLLAGCIATGAEELVDALSSSHGETELVSEAATLNEAWGKYARRVYRRGVAVAFRPEGGAVGVLPKGDYVGGKGRVFLVVDKRRRWG